MQAENNVTMLAPQKSFFNNIARSERLHPAFNFVRASEGSYFNKEGLMVYAPNNTPRIEFDLVTRKCLGAKVEPTVTNYIKDSRISNYVPLSSGTGGNGLAWVCLFGFQTAIASKPWLDGEQSIRLIPDDQNVSNQIFYYIQDRSIFNSFQTFSVYVKPVLGNNLVLDILDNSGNPAAGIEFNFSLTGEVTHSGITINEDLGSTPLFTDTLAEVCRDGWYRIGMSFMLPYDDPGGILGIIGISTYKEIQMHGAQLENTPYFTSFVRTPSNSTAIRYVDNINLPASILSKYTSSDGFTIVTDFNNKTVPNCNHIVAGPSLVYDTNHRCRILVHDFEYTTFVIQLSGRMAGNSVTKNSRLAYQTSRSAWRRLDHVKTALGVGGGKRAALAMMGKTSVEFLEDGDFKNYPPTMYLGTYNGSSAVSPTTTAELAVCGHFREVGIIPSRVDNRVLRALSDQVIDQALYDEFGFVQPLV